MTKTLTVPQFNMEGVKMADFAVTAVFPEAINTDLLTQVLLVYQTNQRQGNADTKNRGDVSGGGKKPWKQKHTGRARAGSTRAPHWRHGGIAHGPVAHEYNATISDKMRQAAFKMALLDKITSAKVAVIDGLPEKASTKKLAVTFTKIVAQSSFTLVLSARSEETLMRSAQNISESKMRALESLNTYDVMSTPWLILSTKAAKKFLG